MPAHHRLLPQQSKLNFDVADLFRRPRHAAILRLDFSSTISFVLCLYITAPLSHQQVFTPSQTFEHASLRAVTYHLANPCSVFAGGSTLLTSISE